MATFYNSPAPPFVPVDPILRALGVAFPSFYLPFVPNCVQSTVILTREWLDLPLVPAICPCAGINLRRFVTEFVPHSGIGDFPIYYFNPQRRIYNVYAGIPRHDGACIMFIPPPQVRTAFLNLGLPVPQPVPAHFCFCIYKPTPTRPLAYTVVSTTLPPLPSDEAHFVSSYQSPSLSQLEAFRRVCYCSDVGCQHCRGPVASFGHDTPYTIVPLATPNGTRYDRSNIHHSTGIIRVSRTYDNYLLPPYVSFLYTWYRPIQPIHQVLFRGAPALLMPNSQSDVTPILRTAATAFSLSFSCLFTYTYSLNRFMCSLTHPYLVPPGRKTTTYLQLLNTFADPFLSDLRYLFHLFLPSVPLRTTLRTSVNNVLRRILPNQIYNYLYPTTGVAASVKGTFKSFFDRATNYLHDTTLDLTPTDTTVPPSTFDVTTPVTFRTIIPTFTRFVTRVITHITNHYYFFPIVISLGLAAYAAYRTPPAWRRLPSIARNTARGAFNTQFEFFDTDFGRALYSRLIGQDNADRSTMRSIARRLYSEMNFPPNVNVESVTDWLATIEEPIQAIVPNQHLHVGCLNCAGTVAVKRRICRSCRTTLKFPFYHQPIAEAVVFVGLRPLKCCDPLPKQHYTFSNNATVTFRGMLVTNTQVALQIYHQHKPPPRGYGHSCGPIICCLEPSVFPPGDGTALVAMAFRMAIDPPFTPNPAIWDAAFSLLRLIFPGFLTGSLDVWSHQQVIQHIKDPDKRLKYESGLNDYEISNPRKGRYLFGCFAKLEKACTHTIDSSITLVSKSKAIPRLINSPKPIVNVLQSPCTLPFYKHLSYYFYNAQPNIFSASGRSPSEINDWFNEAWSFSLCIIEDDVSFMDLSQSEDSLNFVVRLFDYFFSDQELFMHCLRTTTRLRIRTSSIVADLGVHNASGVPTTTISNTIVCIMARVCALAFTIIKQPLNLTNILHYAEIINNVVIPNIRMAVAGDDGYLLVSPTAFPNYRTPQFLQEYSDGFASFGLDVGLSKIRTFSEANWRLSTFLALRPYRTTTSYQLGPEIARRLTTAFWKLESPMHPVAWMRANAQALILSSGHVPILSDVCKFVLRTTHGCPDCAGPTIEDSNPYSISYKWTFQGEPSPLALCDMMADYGFDYDCYADFIKTLDGLSTPFVNLHHPIFNYIFAQQ